MSVASRLPLSLMVPASLPASTSMPSVSASPDATVYSQSSLRLRCAVPVGGLAQFAVFSAAPTLIFSVGVPVTTMALSNVTVTPILSVKP